MSKIGMTPDQSVEWYIGGCDRGTILLPEDPASEVIDLLFKVDTSNPDLELAGVGSRYTGAAKVYRLGDYALRVTENSYDPGHSGLAWLTANVSLSVALSSYPAPDILPKVVRTPQYLGAIIGDNGSRVLMSYEGSGRKRAEPTISKLVNEHCKQALDNIFPNLKIFLDTSPNNTLVGQHDAIKLDVQTA